MAAPRPWHQRRSAQILVGLSQALRGAQISFVARVKLTISKVVLANLDSRFVQTSTRQFSVALVFFEFFQQPYSLLIRSRGWMNRIKYWQNIDLRHFAIVFVQTGLDEYTFDSSNLQPLGKNLDES